MKHNREMLHEHGTELMMLKPSSLLSTARADLMRSLRNSEEAQSQNPAYQHYAFHRKHVRQATDDVDLLTRALMDPVPGLESGKYNTRLIYGNAGLLLAAIKLTREAPGE